MEFTKALDQISAIHAQLAKSEVYRGYRPVPVALSGVAGLAAAWLQPNLVPAGDGLAYCIYWIVVAAVSAAIGGGVILYKYVCEDDAFSRRRTRQVVGQFLPCLLAGMVVTAAALFVDQALIPWLPGLWAVLYGLGVFASRPYLPRTIGWVALFYLAAGGVLLLLVGRQSSLQPWSFGLTFGIGQLAVAAVLQWNLTRMEHGYQANGIH